MPATLILLLIVLLALAAGIKSYNTLQPLRLAVQKSKSNVDVALKKKMSLLNQLIDLVKNYQQSEQFVQLKMAQDANATLVSGAFAQTGSVLNSIQGMAERFPNLKASEQYTHLSNAITTCEDDIQATREFYNDAVEAYNAERLRIPTVFIARFIGFNELNFHHADVSGMHEATTLNEFTTGDGERLQELLSGNGHRLGTTNAAIINGAGQTGGLIGNGLAHLQPDGSQQNGSARNAHI